MNSFEYNTSFDRLWEYITKEESSLCEHLHYHKASVSIFLLLIVDNEYFVLIYENFSLSVAIRLASVGLLLYGDVPVM